jgi:predicted transposase YdaD
MCQSPELCGMENKPIPPIPESGNIYDKIIKENALELFKAFTPASVWTDINPLPGKLQSTLERELDMLYMVTEADGTRMLVHMEFQTTPDPEMHYRMLVYFGLISQKYKLPVWQMVIYLGTKPHRMIERYAARRSNFEYDIIALNELDPQRFISSQVPEVIIFAVFAKFGKEQTEQVLRSIIIKLQQCCQDLNKLKKYHAQLLNLARLRKFDHLLIENFNTMPIYIELEDVETDYLYNKGKLDGTRLALQIVDRYKKGLDIEAIALELDVDPSKVEIVIKDATDMGLI